jgi:glycosyltransferase involved in cell wall biosynthesis
MNKVLVYTKSLLPYSETFIREQLLAMQDWQAVLVGECALGSGLALEGLDIRLLRSGGERPLLRLHRFYRAVFGRPFPEHLSLLRGENAQLVHVHFGPNATDIWPLVRRLGLPMLVTLHGYDINTYQEWWESGRGGSSRIDYPWRLLSMAHHPGVHFIAVSHAIRQRAIEFGLPADKVSVHYIGVDTERFRPGAVPLAQREQRILFVGRQIENKGLDVLLRALAGVQRRVPDACLVVVGDGPCCARNQSLAAELGVWAEFLGVLPPEAVKAEMDRARVFCLPSLTIENGESEGMPISILEALACGVPVVTSARGGRTEGIEDGVNGFAFAEGDRTVLGEKLVQLLCMPPALLEAFSVAARQRAVQYFDLRQCTASLTNFYSDFIAERQTARERAGKSKDSE